jgi:hypothetical protein
VRVHQEGIPWPICQSARPSSHPAFLSCNSALALALHATLRRRSPPYNPRLPRLPPPTCASRSYTNTVAATRTARKHPAQLRDRQRAVSPTSRRSSTRRSAITAIVSTYVSPLPRLSVRCTCLTSSVAACYFRLLSGSSPTMAGNTQQLLIVCAQVVHLRTRHPVQRPGAQRASLQTL